MTPPDPVFTELIRRAAAGDDQARQELFEQYHRAVYRVVRRLMPNRLRGAFDSLDFVQDVWASFLALPPHRLNFTAPQALAGFLARMARHKLLNALEKRINTTTRERVRFGPAAQPNHDGQTPSQLVIAAERWGTILQQFPPNYHGVLEQLREGCGVSEIAARLNVPQRTVERIVRRLKNLCEQSE
jgi:RNA polymerase sigma-70 factor (ECF subfamily)